MAEITVRAIDSALAMEEVQKRLGDDALIIQRRELMGKSKLQLLMKKLLSQKRKLSHSYWEIFIGKTTFLQC